MTLKQFLTWAAVIYIATFLIIWFKRFKPKPDPWEGMLDKDDLEHESKPVCLNCSRPIDNPSQHYCPKCGNITGEYTRYMPFVNIRFNYSIFGKIWKSLKDPKIFFPFKIFYILLIIFMAPVMLVVWLIVIICAAFKRLSGAKKKSQIK